MAQSVETPAAAAAPEKNQSIRFLRYLSTRNTSAMALAGCLGLAELLPVGIGIGLWPSADLGRVLALATGFNLLLVLLYALIGAIVPRSGADYLFASRVLPAPLAFAGNFGLFLAAVGAVGALAILVTQAVVVPFLLYTGTVFKVSTLTSAASSLSQQQGAIIVGSIVVLLAFLLSGVSSRNNTRFLWISLGLALAGWGAILFQLATADGTNFQTQWNLVVGQDSYAQQVSAARSLSLMFSSAPSTFLLAGIPLGILVFFGARSPVFNSGEVKGSAVRAHLLGGGFAVLVCGGLAFTSAVLITHAIPLDWLAAESHLFLYTNQSETAALPWLPFYAALLKPIYPLYVLSTLGTLAALIAAMQVFLCSLGRTLVAWSGDHLAPDLAEYIHPGTRVPIVAILFVAILAEIGVWIAATYGVMKTLNSVMFALVCFSVFPALAAILFPIARRHWAKAAFPQVEGARAALLQVSGVLVLAYLAWMIVISFVYPATGSAIGIWDLVFVAIPLFIGFLWYFYRAHELKRSGIDVRQRFTTLPEE